MRKLWILAIVFVVALALGCGEAKKNGEAGGDGKNGGEATKGGSGGTPAAAGSVEAAVHEMMAGFKKGDPDPFLKHMDLEGVYEFMVSEEERAEMSFEDFKTQMREGMLRGGAPPEGFDYKIAGTKKQGDVTIVTVKVKESAEAEWEESDVEFKKMDGVWKMTAEGFQKMME